MVDLRGFDANKFEPAEEYVVPRAGDYNVVLDSSDEKPTKDGESTYLNCKFKILEGEFKGAILFFILNIGNKNEQARQIAMRQLSSLCRAVGVMTPHSSEQLHNIPLTVSVINKIYEGKPKAEITGFFKLGSRKKEDSTAKKNGKDNAYSETIKDMEKELETMPAKKMEKKPWD